MRVVLPIHAHAAHRGALAQFWDRVRASLEAKGFSGLPTEASWEADEAALFDAGDVLLAQVSGYALALREGGTSLRALARPAYRVEGADGPSLRGILIVPSVESVSSLGGLRGAVAAIDSRTSDIGYNAFRATVAPYSRNGTYFASVTETGSPFVSVEHVATGRADVACVDGVTLAIMGQHAPDTLRRIRRLAGAEYAPAPPFVTSEQGPLAEALAEVLVAVGAEEEVRTALMLEGIEAERPERAAQCLALKQDAEGRDYPDIR